MRKNTGYNIALLVIMCILCFDLSFANVSYIVPIKVSTSDSVLEIYGMFCFYGDIIKGKDELGKEVKFDSYLLKDFESMTVVNKKDMIIVNGDGDTIKIFDISHFFTPKGLKCFKIYELDKDSYAIWVEEDNFGYLNLTEIKKIKRNGPIPESPRSVLTGRPKDLMIGRGLYRIEFRTAHECPAEFQSDSKKIKEKELRQIFPLLIGVAKGLQSRYLLKSIYDYSGSIRNRNEYCDFTKERIRESKETILELKNYDIISEFESHRNSIVKNYEERLKYMKIMFKWLENDDFDKFSNDVIEFYSDTTVLAILESIEESDNWLERFKMMHYQLYNYLNKVKFPFAELKSKQELSLKKNHLRIVYDPRCHN